jgi:hypothetical protein
MTPAEKRIKDQIDRWLVSLDLHLQYVDLNDFAYNRIQPWPVHDRPTRLVLDLAKQKTLELKAALDARMGTGDAKFAESLELMSFLANLIGSQHVQRFIPLADPERAPAQSMPTAAKPIAAPAPPPAPAPVPTPTPAPPKQIAPEPTITSATMAPTVIMPQKPVAARNPVDDDATREMPKPAMKPAAAPVAAPPKPAPKPEARKPVKDVGKDDISNELKLQIIADAVRLINWGRPWHELAEAIARMADRPSAGELRRILRTHRAEIERRAAAEVATPKKTKK